MIGLDGGAVRLIAYLQERSIPREARRGCVPILDILGKSGNIEAMIVLEYLVRNDQDVEVRKMATEVLIGLLRSDAVPLLEELTMTDSSPEVRAVAAISLGELENPAAIPALLKLYLKARPIANIGQFFDDLNTAMSGSIGRTYYISDKHAAEDALLKLVPLSDDIGHLEAALEVRSTDIAASAAERMIALEGGAEVLVGYLQHPSSQVRAAVATALGDSNDPKLIPDLVALYSKPWPWESDKDAAKAALLKLIPLTKNQSHLDMARQLQDPEVSNSVVDRRAVIAVSPQVQPIQVGDTRDKLVRDLRSQDFRKRAVAALTLGQSHEKEAIPDLLNMLTEFPEVGEDTYNVLWALPLLIMETDNEKHLAKALQYPDVTVKAATRLAFLNRPEPLIEALKEDTTIPSIRAYIAAELSPLVEDSNIRQALIRSLKTDLSEEVRQRAVESLGEAIDLRAGKTPDSEVREAVREALQDSDPVVRRYAADALGKSKDPSNMIALLKFLDQHQGPEEPEADVTTARFAVEELIPESTEITHLKQAAYHMELAKEATQRLAELKKYGTLVEIIQDGGTVSPYINQWAVQGLVESGDPDVIPQLQACLRSESRGSMRVVLEAAIQNLQSQGSAQSSLPGSPQAVFALQSDGRARTRQEIVGRLEGITSERTIQPDLAFLINADVIIKDGRGNDASYQLAPELEGNQPVIKEIQDILEGSFVVLKDGFQNEEIIREEISAVMKEVMDDAAWRQRAETALSAKYASYELNETSIPAPDGRTLVKALHDLEWLEPEFSQRAGQGRIIYNFALSEERVNIEAFSGTYAESQLQERDTREVFLGELRRLINNGQTPVFITTDEDQEQRLNDQISEMFHHNEVLVVRLRENTPAAKQWENVYYIVGNSASFDFKTMSVENLLANKDLIQELATAK